MFARTFACGVFVSGLACVSASADTVTAHLAVDNGFFIYISTDDSVLGTPFATNPSGYDWTTTMVSTTALIPNVTNYIHVVTVGDGSTIEAFLGQFNVTGSFLFDNGGQQLTTDTTHWRESSTGFGNWNLTPTSDGTNGVGPWGARPNIDGSAQWLQFDLGSTRYFSTTLTVVPFPPAAWAGLSGLAGLAGWGVVRRRRVARS